jgi:hypothetical protein
MGPRSTAVALVAAVVVAAAALVEAAALFVTEG